MVRKYLSRFMPLFLVGLSAMMLMTDGIYAGAARIGEQERTVQKTQLEVRTKIVPLLERYCKSYCELIRINVDLDEGLAAAEDLGFESSVQREPQLIVRNITAEIQIDDRIGEENRNRLGKILSLHMRQFGLEGQVSWQPVTMPKIGETKLNEPISDDENRERPAEADLALQAGGMAVRAASFKANPAVEQRLKSQIEEKLAQIFNAIIGQYCPGQCLIEKIETQGSLVPVSEVAGLAKSQYVLDVNAAAAYKIERIEADVALDQLLDEKHREKIVRIMQAKAKIFYPVFLNVGILEFPETYAQRIERKNQSDPYGLEKLRQMLIMFRDLAGTKEIITNTTTKNDSVMNSLDKSVVSESSNTKTDVMNSEKSSSEVESKSSSVSATKSDTSASSQSSNVNTETSKNTDISSAKVASVFGDMSMGEVAGYAAGLIVLIGLMILAVLRFGKASRDANDLLDYGPMHSSVTSGVGAGPAQVMRGEGEGGHAVDAGTGGNLALSLKINELKNELVEMFLQNPKIARETFSRFLKEDGVEATARYLHIFGYMIIYELLSDPALQRELYELSEYYHNSNFKFTLEEEYDLIVRLKTRVTASEIRVLTQKSSEKFEFLQKLDADQIYNLIADEKVQLQSIVLTQLDRKRRRQVFDMYQGDEKVLLMEQLSHAEAIPKEYLYNVAKVLAKKVAVRPEFDTENIRSSDVLMDLLEKADLDEQRQLMATMQKNNADTARSLKMKLVTIEIMPFLKDGHLLELVLGIEREDLLMFLAGTKLHIRNLLLKKAPDELAGSWMEDLENIGGVDEQTYKVAEMKILGRIRSLANNGTINLLDINERIFMVTNSDYQRKKEDVPPLPKAVIAA
jgi:flagellar motor switch protein FliG